MLAGPWAVPIGLVSRDSLFLAYLGGPRLEGLSDEPAQIEWV
jgi:hypothetical protein